MSLSSLASIGPGVVAAAAAAVAGTALATAGALEIAGFVPIARAGNVSAFVTAGAVEVAGNVPVATVSSSAYVPAWVASSSGYLTYPGTNGVGIDSDTIEIVWRFKNMDALPAARTEIYAIPGGRVSLYFLTTGRLNCNLSSNAPANLFTWQSSNDASGLVGRVAGDYEFRMQAQLDASPTVVFSRRLFTSNIAGAWTTITGAASVGPLTGSVDGARGGTGVHAILASITGTNIASPVHFAHLWYKAGSLQAADAFGIAGQPGIDPALVDTPDLLIKAADPTDDLGAGKVWTINGTLTPV